MCAFLTEALFLQSFAPELAEEIFDVNTFDVSYLAVNPVERDNDSATFRVFLAKSF
jgi:hypothetical protein